jgi:hypothetical protein
VEIVPLDVGETSVAVAVGIGGKVVETPDE